MSYVTVGQENAHDVNIYYKDSGERQAVVFSHGRSSQTWEGNEMDTYADDLAKLAGRSQFFKDLTTPFYCANRPGAKVSQGVRDSFWLQGMLGGFKGIVDCIKAFTETDFTEDLKRFDVPTLILHGDDDQSKSDRVASS